MLKFWHWTLDTWTLVVAVVALIQPWAAALWRRLFRTGVVDIYETALIELGYSALGATVGLVGTLRARDKDLFIQSMNLTVTRRADKFLRRFEWLIFRTAKAMIGQSSKGGLEQGGEISADIPSSFMISTLEPYRFNILFSDTLLFYQELRPVLEGVSQAWMRYAREAPELSKLEGAAGPAVERKLRPVYERFAAGGDYTAALSAADKLFYWQPGTYELTLHVNTAQPNRHYSKTWLFDLKEPEVQGLRQQNVPIILKEVCGVSPPVQYGFIYTPYLNKRDKGSA
ncbi:MAG TPA: hypothetical protein VF546_11585 [Pyrinomonadaceae bacterium]